MNITLLWPFFRRKTSLQTYHKQKILGFPDFAFWEMKPIHISEIPLNHSLSRILTGNEL
jgi:hypothetical protein